MLDDSEVSNSSHEAIVHEHQVVEENVQDGHHGEQQYKDILDVEDSPEESVPRRPPISSSMLNTSHTISENTKDPEMVHLEMQLDMWCTDMKRNIMVSIYTYVCTYVYVYIIRIP